MHVPVDHHSGEPVNLQISEAIKFRIASGNLSAGDQPSSIHELSRQLSVNPRTVQADQDDSVANPAATSRPIATRSPPPPLPGSGLPAIPFWQVHRVARHSVS